MPELPEVETVARDLRRLVMGARIVGVRCDWLRTRRSQDPEAFARAVVGRAGGGKGFKGFGPEPLDPAFTARAFRKRIRGRKGRLKPLLLDQGFLAGVGNIYADEALWAARLHPLRSAASLRPADEGRLYHEVRRSLAEAH